MFYRKNLRFIIITVLLTIFNFFFWKEKLGVNFFIFTLLLAISILITSEEAIKNRKALVVFAAVIFSGIMVVIQNSFYGKFSVFTCIFLLAGYSHQPQIRSVFSSYISCMLDYCIVPVVFIEGIRRSREQSKVFRIIFKSVKLVIIPLFIVFIFYLLYTVSNAKFDFYSNIVLSNISDFLYKIFRDYTLTRFMFIFLGLILITGVLHARRIGLVKDIDTLFTEKLSRDKNLKLIWLNNGKRYTSLLRTIHIFGTKLYALLTEYRMGLILLILINLLILGLNIVDIKFLWLSFDPSEIPALSDFVYTGTYILIFSISLSMLILLYYFRGNINFYYKNRLLKILSYLWIVQNAFMASSVFLRNYYYIIYTHTISYKKIGVIIFLALTFFGLVTMVLKIAQKRTAYNILKTNAWAVFSMMLIMCSFNWDKNIAEYNLANPETIAIDIAYLLELSDDVLPYINERRELTKRDFYIPRSDRRKLKYAEDYFLDRVDKFNKEQSGYSWLSWNYSDDQINEYFKNHEIKVIENEKK
jgi:uncharacterized protein DUF4153